MRAEADGTHSSVGFPTRLVFGVTNGTVSNASNAVAIDSTGFVGIGTIAPTYNLEVSGDNDGAITLFRLENADTTYSQTVDFQLDTNKDLVISGGSSAGGIRFDMGTRGYFFENGNVGIGTTTPSNLLDVRGVINASAEIYVKNGTAVSPWLYNQTTAALTQAYWNLSGTSLFPNSLGYNVGIGTASPLSILQVKSTSLSLDSDDFTGLYIDNSGITSAEGAFGVPIEFSRLGLATRKRAAISAVQSGSSASQVGLSLFVSDGTTNSTNPIIEAMRIAAGGFVGINTTSPNYLLELNSRDKSLNVSNSLFVNSSSVGIGTANPLGKLVVSGKNESNVSLLFRSDDSTLANTDFSVARIQAGFKTTAWNSSYLTFATMSTGEGNYIDTMTLTDAGKVGIGTTAPTHTLNVVGTSNFTGNIYSSGNITLSDLNSVLYLAGGTSNYIDFANAGLGDPTSTAGWKLALYNNPSDSGAYGLGVSAGQLWLHSDADIALWSSQVQRVLWDESDNSLEITGNFSTTGNIGIGTSTPSNKLDVRGDINASAEIYVKNGTAVSPWLYNQTAVSGTGNLSGGGTAGYIPQFSGTSGLNSSPIYTSGGSVGIGTLTPTHKLDVDLGVVTGNDQIDENQGFRVSGDATGNTGWAGYLISLNSSTENITGVVRLARTS